MTKPFVSIYGHVTIDHILKIEKFPEENTTENIISNATNLGGVGANIGVVASKLGCPTALCAFVGDDFPSNYEEYMKNSGLIMDEFIQVEGYKSSQAFIVNDKHLTQKVLFYQGPQGIADSLGFTINKNAKQSKYVHFCAGKPEYYISIMKTVKGYTNISLDPAQESHSIWNANNFSCAIKMTDILFCNNYEAEFLKRYLHKSNVIDIDVGAVICTDGSNGSVVRVGNEIIRVPAVKAKCVVDTTGAGDSYRGGLYAALYKGYSIPDSLVIAASVSSFTVEKVGALTNIPTWDEVLARAEPYMV